MDIKKLRDSHDLVEQLETALQTAYDTNEGFNTTIDEADVLVVKSLKEADQSYFYKPSEILYWVDREAYLDELDYWEGSQQIARHEIASTHIKQSDQMAVFLDLVDAIRNRRIAPFVGAGLSQACGYPMWGEALYKIAQKLDGQDVPDIQPLMAQYNYLEVAQLLYDVSAHQVNHFIQSEFRQRPNRVQGAVLLLPELAQGCIVTTNFDSVIEDLFYERRQPFKGYMHGVQAGNAFVKNLLRGERCILKLHGDAGQENTYVFTEHQYQAAYGAQLSFQNTLPRTLRQIFISHSLLFLGCSLEQDKTLDLFRTVIDEASFDIPDHFALLSKPSTPQERAQKEERLLRLKIRPLWYETPTGGDGIPDHGLLEQILKLAIAVARRQVVFE